MMATMVSVKLVNGPPSCHGSRSFKRTYLKDTPINVWKKLRNYTPFENMMFDELKILRPQNSMAVQSFRMLTPHVFEQYSCLMSSLYGITGNMSVTPFDSWTVFNSVQAFFWIIFLNIQKSKVLTKMIIWTHLIIPSLGIIAQTTASRISALKWTQNNKFWKIQNWKKKSSQLLQ